MHSSTHTQKQEPSALGYEGAQLFLSALFGPAVDMGMEAAQVVSEIYTDRFEAKAKKADNRTNGHEGGYELGVKHSLGKSFNRIHDMTANNENTLDMAVPYWKRDYGYNNVPRFAA